MNWIYDTENNRYIAEGAQGLDFIVSFGAGNWSAWIWETRTDFDGIRTRARNTESAHRFETAEDAMSWAEIFNSILFPEKFSMRTPEDWDARMKATNEKAGRIRN